MDVPLLSRRRSRSTTTTQPIEEPVVLPDWCPDCGGVGYLDSINLERETKMQTCQGCGLRWETSIANA